MALQQTTLGFEGEYLYRGIFFSCVYVNWKKVKQRPMYFGLLGCVRCFMSMSEVGMVKLNCSFSFFHNLFYVLQTVLSTFVHFEN